MSTKPIDKENKGIKVVLKDILVYIVVALILSAILISVNYINIRVIRLYPYFPDWISSLVVALLGAMAISMFWKRLRQSDALKYEFISVITHKFRTPLTSIKWSGENLVKSVTEDLREDARNIVASADSLVELTDILVNISGKEDKSYEYAFKKVDLGELLNVCVAEHEDKARAKGISIIYASQSGACSISADAQRMRFVFQTLLDNAISYTPHGGKISAGMSLSLDEKKVLVTVSDTGIGVSKDNMKHLFSKFYRADNGRKVDTEGMGIGLYLSRRIIERHNGQMWVESQGEDKGTTFYISLPMVEE